MRRIFTLCAVATLALLILPTCAFNTLQRILIGEMAQQILKTEDQAGINKPLYGTAEETLRDIEHLLKVGFYGFYEDEYFQFPNNIGLLPLVNKDAGMFEDYDKIAIPFVYDKIAPGKRYPSIPSDNMASMLSQAIAGNTLTRNNSAIWSSAQNLMFTIGLMPQLTSTFDCVTLFDGEFEDNYGKDFLIYYNSSVQTDHSEHIPQQQLASRAAGKIYTNIHDLFHEGMDAEFITSTKLRYSTEVTKKLSKSDLKIITAEAARLLEMHPADKFSEKDLYIPKTYSKTALKNFLREWTYQTYLQAVKVYHNVLLNPPMNQTRITEVLGAAYALENRDGEVYEVTGPRANQPLRREISAEQAQYFKFLHLKSMVLAAYRLAHVMAVLKNQVDESAVLFAIGGISQYWRAAFIGLVCFIALILFVIVQVVKMIFKYNRVINVADRSNAKSLNDEGFNSLTHQFESI